MRGPIDYVAIGFAGNNFDGSILAELKKAVDSGAISVVDLVFITKDADGNTTATEIEDQSDDLKNVVSLFNIDGEGTLLSSEDVDLFADTIEPSTSAGVLVIEHVWAKGLKAAILNAGGVLLAEGRVSAEEVNAIDSES